MNISRRFALLAAVAIAAGASGVERTTRAAPLACDRACLEGFVDRYIEALVAHDPSKIPVTADVRFVENGVQLPLGSALWKTASGRGTYSHYFADTTAEQAGFIGTLREHGQGMILVLRLAVRDGKIADIEQLAIRTRNVDEYEKLKMDPLWLAPVPEAQRLPRDRLAALVNRYYTGMQGNDPHGDYSFFHKDCNRIEHGRQTTNNAPSNYGHSDIPNFVTMGCEAQFQTGFLGFVTLIRDRRYPVIDEERQTALAFAAFDHNGSIRKIPLSTGQMFNVPPYFSTPRTLTIAEGFKVLDDKLRLIEATLTESAYGMRNAVDAAPRAPVRRPGDRCDDACARPLVDGVLAAMIAHDPAKAPLAPDVRYTENGQPLAVGDGLWRTLTARAEHALYLTGDGDVAVLTPTVETDIPGQLTLRLREKQGPSDRDRSADRPPRDPAARQAARHHARCSRRRSSPTSTRHGSRRRPRVSRAKCPTPSGRRPQRWRSSLRTICWHSTVSRRRSPRPAAKRRREASSASPPSRTRAVRGSTASTR